MLSGKEVQLGQMMLRSDSHLLIQRDAGGIHALSLGLCKINQNLIHSIVLQQNAEFYHVSNLRSKEH